MCGRVLYNHKAHELRDDLEIVDAFDFAPSFNIAPTEPIPAIRTWGSIETARWGLATLANPRAVGINARRERLGIYAGSKRVLVVVSGFYEWRSLGGGRKQPFAIYRADGQPLVFAGLDDGTGVAVITGPARGFVASVHDRMPAVLERDAFRAWLDPSERAAPILDRVSADALTMHPVSNDVGDVRRNGPELLARVEELPVVAVAEQLDMFGGAKVRAEPRRRRR